MKTPTTVPCSVCQGEGYTYEDTWSPAHGHSTKDRTCDECEGRGEIAAEPDDDDEPATAEFAREVAL